MFSNFNENWYLGLFWSEELIGNDEICIQGHFYEATIFKLAANKIVKLSMVSDFNENWYLGVFWNEELVGALNSEMGVVWELLCLHPNTIKPSYYYYITPTVVRWCIVIPRFFFTLITSPRLLSGDVLLFYVSFSLLLLLLFLFFHTFLSALFLGDALIKLYETL